MTGVDAMEVELEDSQVLLNSPDLNRQAVILQKNLEELKMKIIKTKAELVVKNQSYGGENMDDLLYGKQEVNEDDLHNLVVQRTKTFLNFTSLQTALKAAQANAAITNALNLEKDTNIQLEEEEEQYVRELLEDQKILAEEIITNQNKVVDQELQLIDSRIKLAEEHRRYQDLFEKVKPKRIVNGETKDGQVKDLQQQLSVEEEKLNQIRFMIQKFMISHPKMGLQFDKDTNESYKNIFMSCGTSPEDLRAKLRQDSA